MLSFFGLICYAIKNKLTTVETRKKTAECLSLNQELNIGYWFKLENIMYNSFIKQHRIFFNFITSIIIMFFST